MEDQYNEQQDQYESDTDKLAFLTIGVDTNGIVDYNVHWKPEEEGLVAIANIFYKLIVDNLSIQILEEIRQQCVLNGSEGDYLIMLNIINKLSEKTLQDHQDDEDNIVVPPDQVFNI